MSDDKKRDRKMQRQVRERQAKTGESYQAAWRQLEDDGAVKAVAVVPLHPSIDGSMKSAAEVLPVDAWRRIGGGDGGGGGGGDGAERPERLIIPLASRELDPSPPDDADIMTVRGGIRVQRMSAERRVAAVLIPPNKTTRIVGIPFDRAFDLERIFISGSGTPGGAGDWTVNDIEIDGRPQLAKKDISGALFSTSGIGSGTAATTLSLSGFDPVERGRELAIIVTYVGPNPEGAAFYGSAVGGRPAQRPTIVPVSSKAAQPFTLTTIAARVENAPFHIARINIDDGANWIVNDVRINGATQFVQSGDVPGDVFQANGIDEFINLTTCDAGQIIELAVTYIGIEKEAVFSARLEGTVLREDYAVAPPDLSVVIGTGSGPGETVIATCNWRAPASDNRTR